MNTGAIAAFKLIRTAGGASAASFIRPIQAVCVSITPPAAVDALSAPTVELQGVALVNGRGDRALRAAVLRPLVRAIETVTVAIAGPQARNAHGVVALEGCGAAGDGWAGGLIAAVVAVRLVVALERG